MNQPARSTEAKTKQPLQGAAVLFESDQQRVAALDRAFDYRGDVTIRTDDGRVIEGYVFDRRSDAAEPYVRVVPRDGGERLQVRYAQIVELVFSGRDTAAGKSWENWVKKYHEKRARGEAANIEPEPLE